MKYHYTLLITILSVITSTTHAKEEPVVRKWADYVATARTASAKDWLIESVSVEKRKVAKEEVQYLGDYRVTIKIRNISKRPIKIATNWSFSSSIYRNPLSKENVIDVAGDREVMWNQCCHPPVYFVVEPNKTYTGVCRNLSKHEGKEMVLSSSGMTIGNYTLNLGNYSAKK